MLPSGALQIDLYANPAAKAAQVRAYFLDLLGYWLLTVASSLSVICYIKTSRTPRSVRTAH